MKSKGKKARLDCDTESPVPGYQQLARELSDRVLKDKTDADGRLPYERDLAREYGVSRCTVRSALEILESQGLVRRVRGWGTFICSDRSDSRWHSTASTVLLAHVKGAVPGDGPRTYYGRIHTGIRRMAKTLGLTIKRQDISGYVRVPLVQYRLPKPEDVGGVVLCGTFDDRYIGMYQSEGVPVVVVDCWIHDPYTDYVAVDVEAEAHTVVDYLADRGHTTLGFLASGRQESTSDLRGFDPDISRLLGHLRMAAHRRGIQIRDEWIFFASMSSQAASVAGELLGLRSRPSAVLCFNDWIMTQMLKVTADRGVRCPEDISIVGRGSSEIDGRKVTGSVSNPELMGGLALNLLAERMRGARQDAVRVAVVPNLVVGTTTGPAPCAIYQ